MTKMNVNIASVIAIADNEYYKVYKNWRDYDKQTYTDCLEDNNRYSFAYDMAVYVGNTNELEKYIERMLNRHCKKNKQGYYEMILSTMLMANLFHAWGADKESEVCSDWYLKLFYNEDFIYQYISEGEISDLWGLR